MCIFLPQKDTTIKIPKLKRFSISEESNVVAYTTEKENPKPLPKKKKRVFKKKKITKEIASDGFPFFIFTSNNEHVVKEINVTDYSISKKGNYVAYIHHQKDKVDSCKLVLYNVNDGSKKIILSAKTSIQTPVWSETETTMSFLFSSDTSKTKQYNLSLVDLKTMKTQIYGDTTQPFFGNDFGGLSVMRASTSIRNCATSIAIFATAVSSSIMRLTPA